MKSSGFVTHCPQGSDSTTPVLLTGIPPPNTGMSNAGKNQNSTRAGAELPKEHQSTSEQSELNFQCASSIFLDLFFYEVNIFKCGNPNLLCPHRHPWRAGSSQHRAPNQEPRGKRSQARTDVHTRVQTHTEASFKVLRKP